MLQIIYKQHAIHYLRLGKGKQILIALHGYGDTAALYKVLLPSLGKRYTIYALDLPYHGRTRWQSDKTYQVSDIMGIVQNLITTEHIARFSLMGYSMGGRIAMCLIPHFINQLNEVFILAASGIKIHPIFNAMAFPVGLIKLLSFNIKYPQGLFATLHLAQKIGIMNRNVYAFNRQLMATENRRKRLFLTWLSIRNFAVNVPALKAKLNQVQIPVYLIFGEKDEIIPPRIGKFFAEGLPNAKLCLIPSNHFLVNEQLNNILDNLLNQTISPNY